MKYLFIILFFISCEIDNGFIIEKKIIKEHDYSYVTYINSGKTLIPIYHFGHKEDEFLFVIKNKNKTNTIIVNKFYYNKYDVGNWYDCNKLK